MGWRWKAVKSKIHCLLRRGHVLTRIETELGFDLIFNVCK